MSQDLTPPANRTPEQVLQQAKNAGALYHHLSWAMKLLGHDPESLPTGEYVLQLHVYKHVDGGVVIPHYDLVKIEPDQLAIAEPVAEHKRCEMCGYVGEEDPIRGCPRCKWDEMRPQKEEKPA